mgnify:CR=1 FL=1
MATINPILDKVVVKVQKAQSARGGIILAGNSSKEQPLTASVIARGPGGMIDGKEVKMYVNPGDNVLIPKHGGTPFNFNGKEYIIIRQADILAIIA